MVFPKDPNAVMDYTIDWTNWLNSGATIQTSTWTVPSDLTKVSDARDAGNKKTTVVLSGGSATLGTLYQVENRITTSDGLTEDRSLLIRMGENRGGQWVYA